MALGPNIGKPLATPDPGLPATVPDMMTVDVSSEEIPDDTGALTTPTADGGVVIDFAPGEPEVDEEISHGANLALYLDEQLLTTLGSDIVTKVDNDLRSREPWEKAYEKGLKLLGLTIEERTQPWAGASGVFHPILSEAVIRTQAQLMSESFPASGPVKTKILGKITRDKQKQAKRVQDDMNYQLLEVMPEYRPETEKLFFGLPFAGSAFRKIYWDDVLERQTGMYVPAEDLIVPYGAADLRTCTGYTHRFRLEKTELKKQQVGGFYRDISIPEPTIETDRLQKAKDKSQNTTQTDYKDARHVMLERHMDVDLDDDRFRDDDGVARPYIVTVDKQSRKVLSVRRNWREDDSTKTKRMHFAHYEYIPGPGFYGIGLVHLLGGIAKAATSITRQLIDAGTLANLPAGLKARGLRIKGDDTPLLPGTFRDVDVPGSAIKDSIMMLPYKEPSQTLRELLGSVVEEGRRLASMADLKIADMKQNAPVGTTLAIIERTMKVMSAVQARTHAALKVEFKLLAELIKEHSQTPYAFEVDEGVFTRATDYDDRVDIVPVSDPNAATMSQRIMQQQAVHQMSQSAPQVYDLAELHRNSLIAMEIPNAEKLVPSKEDTEPSDPVSENMSILASKPTKAFMHQDHESHITVHMAALQDPKINKLIEQSPMKAALGAAMAAHVQEHIGFQYRREIEKQMGVELPPPDEMLPEDVEVQLSRLTAEAAERVLQQNQMEAQQEKNKEVEEDPLFQLQKMELRLKELDLQRKGKTDNDKLEVQVAIERAKLLLAQEELRSQERIEGAKIGAGAADAQQQAALEEAKIASKEEIEGAKIGASVGKSILDMGKNLLTGRSDNE